MAHTCNPSTLGGQGGWITWGQELESSLNHTTALQPGWQSKTAPKKTNNNNKKKESLSKLGIEEKFLNLIHGICEKLTAAITHPSEKVEHFPHKIKKRQGWFLSPLPFSIVLERNNFWNKLNKYKWRDILCSWFERLNVVMMLIHPKLI